MLNTNISLCATEPGERSRLCGPPCLRGIFYLLKQHYLNTSTSYTRNKWRNMSPRQKNLGECVGISSGDHWLEIFMMQSEKLTIHWSQQIIFKKPIWFKLCYWDKVKHGISEFLNIQERHLTFQETVMTKCLLHKPLSSLSRFAPNSCSLCDLNSSIFSNAWGSLISLGPWGTGGWKKSIPPKSEM